MKRVKDASLILKFHTYRPWSMDVSFIKIRNIGGEGYKNWTVGILKKWEWLYYKVLGMSSLTDLWDIQVYSGYRGLNTLGFQSSEDIRLFFGKAYNY